MSSQLHDVEADQCPSHFRRSLHQGLLLWKIRWNLLLRQLGVVKVHGCRTQSLSRRNRRLHRNLEVSVLVSHQRWGIEDGILVVLLLNHVVAVKARNQGINIASGVDGPADHHADDLVTFNKRQRRTVLLSETSEDQTVPA